MWLLLGNGHRLWDQPLPHGQESGAGLCSRPVLEGRAQEWDMWRRGSRAGSQPEQRDKATHCCTCFY